MRSEERKKSLGEVFTPPALVKEILDQLPPEVWKDTTKTFLDNSCGNGNFLVALFPRMADGDSDPANILSRIHGVDIMQDNVEECRLRLLDLAIEKDPTRKKDYLKILEQNIVCADGLRYHYRFDGTPPYDEEYVPEAFEIPNQTVEAPTKTVKEKPASVEDSDLFG